MFTGKRTHIYFLVLLGFLIRVASFLLSKNFDGDAIIRTLMAANWLRDPFFITHANPVTWVFGPLHYYLIGLSLLIWNNPLDSPRLLSLILGTLTIVPFYYLVELKFNKNIAFYSTLFFCFYTLHVRYSGVATSETPYLFFLLVSVFLFFKFKIRKEIFYLLVSAFFLNLSMMIRYETLMFVPILGFLLFIDEKTGEKNFKKHFQFSGKNLRYAFIFCSVALIFIVSRFFGDYLFNNDPFYSLPIGKTNHLTMIAENIQKRGYLLNLLYNSLFWPGVIFLTFTPLIATLALLGLIRSLRKIEDLDFVVLFLVIFLLYTYQSTFGKGMTPFARFSLIFGVYLLPFAGKELIFLITSLSKDKARILAFLVFLSMVVSFGIMVSFGIPGKGTLRDKISSVSPVTFLPYYVEELIAWVDKNVNSSELIILDQYADEFALIKFYSKLSDQQVNMKWKTDDEMMQFISYYKPKYLLYSPYGKLKSLLHLDSAQKIQKEKGLSFQLLYKTKNYQIYQIIY